MKKLALILLFLCGVAFGQDAPFSQYILYKSGGTTLPTTSQTEWLPPASAYTAVTIPFPFDTLHARGAQAASASAQIVWKANSLYANTGVGIHLCPAQSHAGTGLVGCTMLIYFAANDSSGPASYTPGCMSNPGGPMPCRADVTGIINNYIAAGVPYYMVIASYGNGTDGPLIWDVELLINWR